MKSYEYCTIPMNETYWLVLQYYCEQYRLRNNLQKKNITVNFDHEMIRKLKLLHISLAYKNLLPKGI